MLQITAAFKQTLLYGFGITLMKGVSLMMLPFIAHHLSPEEFGRLEVISALAVIGSVLVGMGLDHTLFRFAGNARTFRQRQRIAAEIFTLGLFIGIITGCIGWLAVDLLAHAVPGNPSTYELRLVISMLALEGCIAIPLGWFRMCNKAFSFFLCTTGRALTQALLVVILLSFDRGVSGVLEAGLIAALVQAMVLSYIQIRDTGFKLSRNTSIHALIYSLPLVGSGLIAFALNGLDRWVLAEYTSLNDVAHFGVAAKFALAMVLLMQPFSMWWSAKRFEVLNEYNGQQKVARFITLGISLALIIAVLVSLSAPLIINWLMPESYAMSSQYVVALVLIMLLKEITELVNIGCFSGKTTGSQFFINMLCASTGIIIMLWLTPIYAVWGVIIALFTAQALRLVLFFIISQYLLRLPYPTHSLITLICISIGWILLGSQSLSIGQQLLTITAGTISLLTTALFLRLIPAPFKLNRIAGR